MTRHVVIGTAGHVDHGKTALVKALTGIETDRFPEEQRRGITIDIGFAHLALGSDLHASIVDVPGHEDFIRNMVAGATGIDVALLVVAADEGVMPQTLEHLAILELLAVPTGVLAITKADLVDPEWLGLVRADVEERVRKTALAWEPAVAVSALTGQGMEELKTALAAGATKARTRAADDLFRMPVDRIFSLAGAGTVITGTTWSGSVRVGDQVSILPEGVSGRVRSVEVHGDRREAAEPGRRTALAVAGLERASAGRGSVVVSDGSWRSTSSIDVLLSVLPDAPRPITQRTRVRLHLGTAELIARVTPAGEAIGPGETGLARLRVESPVVARWGDRGVIRAYSPVLTIGGCVVVDPWPQPRPRRPAYDARRASREPVERVRGFALSPGSEGLALADLPVRAGVPAGEMMASVGALRDVPDVVRLDDHFVSAALVEDVRVAALEVLAEDHRARPLAPGMSLELLRQRLKPLKVGEHVLTDLQRSGRVIMEGSLARLADHAPSLTVKQDAAARDLIAVLAAAGAEGRTLAELGAGRPEVATLLGFLVRQTTAVQVGPDRYYERSALDRVARAALAEIERLGEATPAELRDKLQLSRKYLIPLLEWLDHRGFTLRGVQGRRVTPSGLKYLRDA